MKLCPVLTCTCRAVKVCHTILGRWALRPAGPICWSIYCTPGTLIGTGPLRQSSTSRMWKRRFVSMELCITKSDGWQDDLAYLFEKEKEKHILFLVKQVGKLILNGASTAVSVTHFSCAELPIMFHAACVSPASFQPFLTSCFECPQAKQSSLLMTSLL